MVEFQKDQKTNIEMSQKVKDNQNTYFAAAAEISGKFVACC